MKEGELPEYLQDALRNLRHSSGSVDYDISDSLYNAESVEDFKDRISIAMNNLIGEAECVKKTLANNIANIGNEEIEEKDHIAGKITIEDAKQIAFETLRIAAGQYGWENFKDFVGRELDITDETIDQAVGLLFSED